MRTESHLKTCEQELAKPELVVDDDVTSLSQRIAAAHRPEVARLACLEFTIANLGHSACTWPDGIKQTLLVLQQECRDAWMVQQGITTRELHAAVASLGRAQTTVRYLDSLPP